MSKIELINELRKVGCANCGTFHEFEDMKQSRNIHKTPLCKECFGKIYPSTVNKHHAFYCELMEFHNCLWDRVDNLRKKVSPEELLRHKQVAYAFSEFFQKELEINKRDLEDLKEEMEF
ncbi:MAG: hypothetical protein LBV67_06195 [Streptococcaceae bacterium]|jgi:NAD-dependent SIR2 family protein deacetylase|nr:hypothetical protein [Streptococcaceae bacterium]